MNSLALADSLPWGCGNQSNVVISQTISLVSQKKLFLRQESPYLLRHCMPSSGGSDKSGQVCHTTLDWRIMNTYLKILGQFLHQHFETMVGAMPQVEMTHNYLDHFWMGGQQVSLVQFHQQLSNYVLSQETHNILGIHDHMTEIPLVWGEGGQLQSQPKLHNCGSPYMYIIIIWNEWIIYICWT